MRVRQRQVRPTESQGKKEDRKKHADTKSPRETERDREKEGWGTNTLSPEEAQAVRHLKPAPLGRAGRKDGALSVRETRVAGAAAGAVGEQGQAPCDGAAPQDGEGS